MFPISYELILGCLGKRELSSILARKMLNIIQIIISGKVFYTIMPEVYHGATKLSIETRCTDKCTCLYCGDTLFNTYTTGVLRKRDSQTNGQLLTMWNHPIRYVFEFLISWTSSNWRLFIKGVCSLFFWFCWCCLYRAPMDSRLWAEWATLLK